MNELLPNLEDVVTDHALIEAIRADAEIIAADELTRILVGWRREIIGCTN